MRCPTCGNDNPYYHGQDTQQDYFHRQMAQYQNQWAQNQLGAAQSNPWQRYGMTGMGADLADSTDRSKDEPEPPKPEPKPTAWGQFKALLRSIIP